MKFKRSATVTLSCLLSVGLADSAYAFRSNSGKMISTSQVVDGITRAQHQAKVDAFLSRAEVQEQLEAKGVTAQEASMRLASLSDAEIQDLTSQMDRAPAGGDAIVMSLTTILLVVVILILIGKI